MYQRVLLAYDGSREGRTALREGALAARRFGAKVFLLCVVAESPGVRIGETAYAGVLAHAQDTYVDLFDQAMMRLRDLGFEPEGKVVTGEPAPEIARYARQVNADLVVVGHRKKGLFERWWSGETGAYLSDHLQCSLLVARAIISDEEFYGELETAGASSS